MTNQMQGEILFKGWAGGTGAGTEDDWVYTPWMPVRGDVATFAVEVIKQTSGCTLTWNIETRTRESVTTSLLAAEQTNTAAVTSSVNPALELVRYKFKTGSGFSTDEWVVFRALQPSWQADR